MAKEPNGGNLDPRFRWLLGVLAFGLLVAGAVATFVSSNDVGTAALVAGGFGLAALAYLGERITRLKYGEFEADMANVGNVLLEFGPGLVPRDLRGIDRAIPRLNGSKRSA